MITCVAFDFDGTLADTLPMCIAAFQRAVSPFAGHLLSPDEVRATFGLNEVGMVQRILGPDSAAALTEFYRCYADMHTLCPTLFPGIRACLDQLTQRGIQCALVTGKGPVCCSISLEKFGLNDIFALCETGAATHTRKDDSLRRVAETLHLRPEQWLYVGDTVSDIEACRRVGIDCFSAGWAASSDVSALRRLNPQFCFETVEAFTRALFARIESAAF